MFDLKERGAKFREKYTLWYLSKNERLPKNGQEAINPLVWHEIFTKRFSISVQWLRHEHEYSLNYNI